ncbi:hypothetical protein NLU13_7470 [Sarocladium strictum]|uniref:Uncharacterized protein n=1 Tax=Sarocladium strictum TaxID=5046 RepID=A0AA39L5L4_SARSR|nr:hypothetical protein NLU13_7470 [Sarocladium strictum]
MYFTHTVRRIAYMSRVSFISGGQSISYITEPALYGTVPKHVVCRYSSARLPSRHSTYRRSSGSSDMKDPVHNPSREKEKKVLKDNEKKTDHSSPPGFQAVAARPKA